MRRPIVAGNWKMNTSLDEARALVEDLIQGYGESAVECLVLPPYAWVVPLHEQLGQGSIRLGAQNCAVADNGAFTGEISASMLAPFCQYIIVGHSERRQLFGESDEVVRSKLEAVLRNGIRAILCVGETLEERESGRAAEVVTGQLRHALRGQASATTETIVVAYEPVWAIGTGKAATPEDAQEMAAVVRHVVAELLGAEFANGVRIQYGGSVNAENSRSYLSLSDVDGALVGGASLKARDFLQIVTSAG